MTTKRVSYLTLNKAVDLMHAGGVLQSMCGSKSAWFILHYGAVRPEHAERIKAMPDVCASGDGLFPGHTQTWRLGPVIVDIAKAIRIEDEEARRHPVQSGGAA